MKNKRIAGLITFLYIVSFGFWGQTAFAEDSSNAEQQQASPTGFTYKVIQPENQQNKQIGYFDLRMQPSQEQMVEIQLTNDESNDIEIDVSLNSAKTNGNGVIEYGPSALEEDASLKYSFTDLVKGPEKVTIPSKTTVPLQLTIKMPEVSYDGVVAGGIQLKRAVDKKEREKQSGVINEYAFLVGMLLTETDTVVQPELKLNKVYGGLNNYRNSVFVNFSNVEAAYLEDLTVDVQIMEEKADKVLYDTKKANMRVAPNSNVDFPVSMNGEKMVPGKYRAKIVATAGDRKWEWLETFTITDEEADKYNKQDVNLVQERGIDWKLIAMIAGGVFVIILIVFLIVRTISKKKEAQKKQKRRKPVKRN